MAKLYFYYSAMNAGKSTVLLQSAYNYNERGMDTLLYMPEIAHRFGTNKIVSRIGLAADAILFTNHFDFFVHVKKSIADNAKIRCILVDEAQFLKKNQVMQLARVVDELDIPVLSYGLRSDFLGEPFEGSQYLLILADNLVEIKTICYCGKKAIMNARIDKEGNILRAGEQVEIGGNERYVAMCRKHFVCSSNAL